MLRSDGLFDRAAAALQRVVAADPDNAAALRRLGDLYRGLGRLCEALDCYARVVATHPDDSKASWLAAILRGKELPEVAGASPTGRPVPFVRMTNFLPAQQCQALLDIALASRERFEPGMVFKSREGEEANSPPAVFGEGIVDPSRRKGLVASRRFTEHEVRPRLEAPLRGALAQALPRLRMREPSKYWVEMTMAAYLHGGFFAKHRDDGAFRTRMVSFSYYFHAQPQRFSGGELLLHDDDGAPTFTRIKPQHNSIVLFPASCVHEVRAIVSDSADFRAARFAVHGWLRAEP